MLDTIILSGKLDQELFNALIKRMNDVQRKTALLIIKKYNLGA